ncbi:FxSxx-COOH cyclophane-containing RiPP peptide [Spirilliplanes yamanashiensis]|uniref:FXSXX-COOH protein n=1 Tax=Spirilliplanes yamanashiensis TaxID=42233 RepID=A0A8J4DL75_9ACTN|nr:FxSxx-COOH cyclophane-containing RiPP peptide [Spirilliplanes yamanashiensis]MDP9816186.1 FXSXX-COOH protein [Spirilliplanes yamanashiensis]GIJ05711.1 hypothetical protein Sya03_50630 [Spirilliplanes yamanashiensis]
MDEATGDGAGPAVWRSTLVDVTELSLAELAATGDDVLAHALRRLAADLESPDEPIAGFNSAF